MNQHRRTVIACATLGAAVLLGAAWLSLRPARGPAPLARSPFLRDVVEPITIVYALSFDDGGSQGIRFKDARGVERDVCLEDTLDDQHNLVLDSFFPHGKNARRVPISGVEERALLGLLTRWAEHDPDARELERRYDLYERGAIDLDGFWKDLPDTFRVKETAVSILRTLRGRNGMERRSVAGRVA